MKRRFITLLILLVTSIGINEMFAANISKVRFGYLGIQHYTTLEEYRETYIGQTVKYIQGTTPLGKLYDKNFIKIGGKFDTEYVIEKITGNNDNMVFVMVEKFGKKKIKLPIRNYDPLYSSVGKYFYSIAKDYSLPLLLIDKFNQAKLDYAGKKYANYEVMELILGEDESKDEHIESDYPSIYLRLKNSNSDKIEYCDINDVQAFEYASNYVGQVYPSKESPIRYVVEDFSVWKSSYSNNYNTLLTLRSSNNPKDFVIYNPLHLDDFNDLGKEFTNPALKCKYTIVGVKREKDNLKYIVENSINKNRKTISSYKPEIESFFGDLDGKFYATLKRVEKPSNASVRYGKTTSITDKDITKYSYVDNFIDIIIFANDKQFVFELKNVSSNTIKIIWNEAVFVDVDGSTSKVMHTGVKYSEREGDQPASTIIKNAKLEDIAAPTSNIYYSDSSKEWEIHSLYRNASQTEKGQTIRLMLPIQVKDVINEYIFEFELSYNYIYPELLNI